MSKDQKRPGGAFPLRTGEPCEPKARIRNAPVGRFGEKRPSRARAMAPGRPRWTAATGCRQSNGAAQMGRPLFTQYGRYARLERRNRPKPPNAVSTNRPAPGSGTSGGGGGGGMFWATAKSSHATARSCRLSPRFPMSPRRPARKQPRPTAYLCCHRIHTIRQRNNGYNPCVKQVAPSKEIGVFAA